MTEEISKETFEKAIEGTRGFVTQIAKAAGCSRQSVYNAFEKWPELKDLVKAEKESFKDKAEGKLFQHIEDGNVVALLFYLKCQAKDRGYVERQEIVGADGGPIGIEFVKAGKPEEETS